MCWCYWHSSYTPAGEYSSTAQTRYPLIRYPPIKMYDHQICGAHASEANEQTWRHRVFLGTAALIWTHNHGPSLVPTRNRETSPYLVKSITSNFREVSDLRRTARIYNGANTSCRALSFPGSRRGRSFEMKTSVSWRVTVATVHYKRNFSNEGRSKISTFTTSRLRYIDAMWRSNGTKLL